MNGVTSTVNKIRNKQEYKKITNYDKEGNWLSNTI
jgi:hypothetical protein